jgi:hypothetical protein
MQPWHLQDHVGVMWDCHELSECGPSQGSIVHHLEIGKSDPTDEGHRCTRDYAMEKGLIGF